jgi:serine/threonine protein phosphatase PrpC
LISLLRVCVRLPNPPYPGIRALKRFGLAPQTFAAVFDGHGGEEASAYLSRHLHLNLKRALERLFGAVPFAQGLGVEEVDALVKEAVMRAFVKTDEDFLSKDNVDAGSTATTVLIMGNRCVACVMAWLDRLARLD